MKTRYYRIERNGIEVKYRKTIEGKDRVVKAWESKGYEVKVSIVYINNKTEPERFSGSNL